MLRITDGTETATLSGADRFLGAAFNPLAGKDEVTPVAESARVILEGTAANVLLDTQKIERILATARKAPSTNVRVYVEFQRTGDTLIYRAQIYDGRLIWSDDPVRNQLFSAATAVEVVVAWERAPVWETSTETDGGSKAIFNGDGSGTDPDGTVVGTTGANAYNAGEWAVTGVLPMPAHVILTNNDNAAVSLQRVWIANDVFARFKAGEHLVSGATLNWGAAATHAVPIGTFFELSTEQIAGFIAAGGMRLLAVFSTVPAAKYFKAWLLQKQGITTTYSDVWLGPEVLTVAGRYVYDLGFLPAPPNVKTFTQFYLALSIYSAASGTADLDFIMLCPGQNVLTLEQIAMSWADNGTLEWHGDRRYAEVNGYHGTVQGNGELLLYPSRNNRLAVLVEGSSGLVNTVSMLLQLKYRQRRATV